jgi:hypothetical protein
MNTQNTADTTTVVEAGIFRNVVGHFASGVTVITTVVDGVLYGTTASAVSSLSMEPPMMLACLNRASSTHDRVVAAGYFGINILADDQSALAFHFGRKGEDKFATVPHTISPEGIPLIDGALEGPVYLRSSSNPLPDLVADLNGAFNVVLAGRIDSVNQGIRNTFDLVPDAPVTSFTLSMQGGRKGLLVNSRNLCKSVNRAQVSLVGQNGKLSRSSPAVANSCRKAGKPKRGGKR